MNLFLKLLAGAFKVLLIMFLQRNTQRMRIPAIVTTQFDRS